MKDSSSREYNFQSNDTSSKHNPCVTIRKRARYIYHRVPNENRQELIDNVMNQKKSLAQVISNSKLIEILHFRQPET